MKPLIFGKRIIKTILLFVVCITISLILHIAGNILLITWPILGLIILVGIVGAILWGYTKPKPSDMLVYRSDNLSVLKKGNKEIVIYGDRDNWMMQYANITNPALPWRWWSAKRGNCEERARHLLQIKGDDGDDKTTLP